MTKTDFAFCAEELARLAEIAERHQHGRLARLLTLAGEQARDGGAAKPAAQSAGPVVQGDNAPTPGS